MFAVDACEYLYPDVFGYASQSDHIALLTARGAQANAQIVLRGAKKCAPKVCVPGLRVTLERLIDVPVEMNPGLTPETERAHCPQRRAPFRVYDCIAPIEGEISGDCALYLRVFADADAKSGVYEGYVAAGEDKLPVTVTVAEGMMPKETLSVVTWFNRGNVAKFHHVTPGTAAFDDMVNKYLRAMRDMRQNVLQVTADWKDGFAEMEKTVETALSLGFTRFMLPPVGGRESWNAPVIRVGGLDAASFEGYKYLAEYLGALRAFLTKKGWTSLFTMGVSDEPNERNALSYRALAGTIRKLFPEMKLLDAVFFTDIHGSLDVYVPQSNDYEAHRDGFETYRRYGADLWHYVCCSPRGNGYVNRFMDMPLLAPRYLFWGNFKYGLTGYLHWAFNGYQPGQDPFQQSCPEHHNADMTLYLPAGDTHLVYPGADGPLKSVRLEAQRAGTEDYEMLKNLAGTKPGEAKAICDSCFTAFNEVCYDAGKYRAARNRLIRSLG